MAIRVPDTMENAPGNWADLRVFLERKMTPACLGTGVGFSG